MLQPINEKLENLLVSQNFSALVAQIKTTQLGNQDLKEIIVQLVKLLFETKEQCDNLLKNQVPAQLEQAKPSYQTENIEEPYLKNQVNQQINAQSSQQFLNNDETFQQMTSQKLQEESLQNDLIDQLQQKNKKQAEVLNHQIEYLSQEIEKKDEFISTVRQMASQKFQDESHQQDLIDQLEKNNKKQEEQFNNQIEYLSQEIKKKEEYIQTVQQMMSIKFQEESHYNDLIDKLHKNNQKKEEVLYNQIEYLSQEIEKKEVFIQTLQQMASQKLQEESHYQDLIDQQEKNNKKKEVEPYKQIEYLSQEIEKKEVFIQTLQQMASKKLQEESLYNDLIDQLERDTKKQEELLNNQIKNLSQEIKKKEVCIYDLKQTILGLNNQLNLLNGLSQSNEKRESFFEILLKQENSQYVEQIANLKQRIQMIEPLKKIRYFGEIDIDPMFDKLQTNLKEIQEDSERVWAQSKEALKLPFEYEKNQPEIVLKNLEYLFSLSNDCFKKYGVWLEKSKMKQENKECYEQLLVSMKAISIYNQRIMKILATLIEEIIKNLKKIFLKHNLIEEQHKQQQVILSRIAASGSRVQIQAQGAQNQIEPIKMLYNLQLNQTIIPLNSTWHFALSFVRPKYKPISYYPSKYFDQDNFKNEFAFKFSCT